MSDILFEEGDQVLIITEDKKSYKVRLKRGIIFSTHQGRISHDDMIGKKSGSVFFTSIGKKITVFSPTLFDYLMGMPRISAIVYPKDIAMIIMWADIFPGAKIVEGGSGSGSLLSALWRASGSDGTIYSYDIRKDMQHQAKKNLRRFFGKVPENIHFKLNSLYDGIEEDDIDRIILDVAEPWEVLPHANKSLSTDGIILAYTPTITQAERFNKALYENRYYFIETFETIYRPWTIKGLSVRPNQRIVGHTAFLTIGRRGSDSGYEYKP